MQAIIRRGDVVALREIEPPRPAPHEVVVRVRAAGICRTDVYVAQGRLTARDPVVLGHECAGVVEEVGAEVSGTRPGDRVALDPMVPCGTCPVCRANAGRALDAPAPRCPTPEMLGVERDGAFAEFVAVPAAQLYRMPDEVSLRRGAYLEPMAASMAVLDAGLEPSMRGVVWGGGRIAELTARVMRAAGFSELTIHTPGRAPAPEPASLDFVVETIATSESLSAIVSALRPGATLVLKSRAAGPVPVDIAAVVRRDLTLRGVHYGSFSRAMRWLAEERVRLDDVLGPVHPLSYFVEELDGLSHREDRKLFVSAHPPEAG